jgi:hypothetical protein
MQSDRFTGDVRLIYLRRIDNAINVWSVILNSSRRKHRMAAGDGNRVWFPEMIETLRSRWNVTMPFPDLVELCNILDGMLQRRRPSGPILPPGSRCAECGRIVGDESQQRHRISIRATILSLGRFGIASPEVTRRTEKEWARYRAENRLDVYGRGITSTAAQVRKDSICAHAAPEE